MIFLLAVLIPACGLSSPAFRMMQSTSKSIYLLMIFILLPAGICSNSCPSSWWCHPIICHPLPLLHSIFPSIRVFSNESVFTDGQSIGTSASESVLPMNIQDWFPFSPKDSQKFSNTTVQKHQFFSTQRSLQSNSHIHSRLL